MSLDSPGWRRAFLRRFRDALRDDGRDACPQCRHQAPPGAHPLDWMSIERQPALLWHGAPDDGEHHMYISTDCRHCYASTLYATGSVWSHDHEDLTTLADEEQELR